MLIDRKRRRYLIELEDGGQFHSHAGYLSHDDLLGRSEGAKVTSTHGAVYSAFRPTLADYVLKMPRGAQVIYPKDLGPILMLADIHPGVRVLETGVGSGALSMTLLRAGATVHGYEIREDFASRAKKNVAGFVGAELAANYSVEIRDAYEGIELEDLDRVVLDLPEPWQVVPHAATALHPGGIIVAYTPSITQVMQFRDALVHHGFGMLETVEVLNRGWHVEGQAVRPDHRMVAHTAFLTAGRLIGVDE